MDKDESVYSGKKKQKEFRNKVVAVIVPSNVCFMLIPFTCFWEAIMSSSSGNHRTWEETEWISEWGRQRLSINCSLTLWYYLSFLLVEALWALMTQGNDVIQGIVYIGQGRLAVSLLLVASSIYSSAALSNVMTQVFLQCLQTYFKWRNSYIRQLYQ